ncbi:hypothetical protein C8T65DRAFT_737437 [Cerioporus squamosus]|nr:hypothetical protein C8T65DRAFT_737437 [Cerioporus squamosus]
MNIPQLARLLDEKARSEGSEYEGLHTQEIESICDLLPVVLSNLRRALNKRRRVNTLPTEILVEIFSLVPNSDKPRRSVAVERFSGPYAIFNVWELFPITLVCHHWRHVSLNVSSLWSSTFIVSDSRTRMVPRSYDGNIFYLDRCKAGPTELYVKEYPVNDLWRPIGGVSGVLETYADRVQELHFDTRDGWLQTELMPEILSHPLPALRRLILESSYSSPGLSWKGPRQTLFAGCALPQLQSLAMLNIPFLPTNPMLSSLTRLLLSYNVNGRFARSGTWSTDLIEFLTGTVALEEAYISGIPVSTVEDHGPPVKLGRMRKISIRAWNYERHIVGICLPLVSRLLLPDSCYIRLDAGSGEEIHMLSQVLARSRKDHTGARVHCVCSRLFYYHHTPLTASSLQTTYPSFGGIRIDIPRTVRWDGDCFQAFRNLLQTPPFAAARALWLSGMDNGSDERYPTTIETCGILPLLGALRNVDELYITVVLRRHTTGQHPIAFMDFLGAATSVDAMGPPQLPFSDLTTLYVYLNDGVYGFARILRQRAEAGYIVPHLLFASDALERSSEEASDSWEKVEMALEYCVGELTILEEREYWDKYALQTVLPPTCMESPPPGLEPTSQFQFDLWPRWTEGIKTYESLLEH